MWATSLCSSWTLWSWSASERASLQSEHTPTRAHERPASSAQTYRSRKTVKRREEEEEVTQHNNLLEMPTIWWRAWSKNEEGFPVDREVIQFTKIYTL